MTTKRFKRTLAFLLAVVVTFTSSAPMQQNAVQVQAASVYENENLLVNPNFDGNEEFQPAGGSHLGNWFSWQGSEKTQEERSNENLKSQNFGLDIYYPELTKERVEQIHSLGLEVNCWTCDSVEAATALIEMGVDCITSNILE